MAKIRKQEALDYHSQGTPGKIEVIPTKATKTQRDLALAYSPGVAEPCLEIAANTEDVYKYTAKGNLVAVISNGTAVLGLGDIGPEASKPVMEGKGVLFKIFAGIDVFDLELDAREVDHFCTVVKALEPTFGGINLEDIKAPECFEIEERLKKEMNIPVMHDDQHGTAIISAAGMLNALIVAGKKIEEVKMVVSGAGASALTCTKIMVSLGMKKENIVMLDSKGALRTDRTDLDKYKQVFATSDDVHGLEDSLVGKDVFLGLSKGGVLTPAMLLGMAPNPIVFAMANPDPEIDYDLAVQTRPDVIMATGRSDYPNQVNNVLGFPFIFRGALDVRATEINEAMKLAAVKAIADLARLPVPELVNRAYNIKNIKFGKEYIIPKPLDPRLLETVAPAVAKAAIESGVAKNIITDWEGYKRELRKRLGADDNLMRIIIHTAKRDPKRVVLAEADNYKVLKAAQIVLEEGIAKPILLGNKQKIKTLCEEYQIDVTGAVIIDPKGDDMEAKREEYAQLFFKNRGRRGYNLYESRKSMHRRHVFGAMMLEHGEADAFVSGLTRKHAYAIRPALDVIGSIVPGKKISSMYIVMTKRGPLFFADTSIIPNPTVDELVDIAFMTAETVKSLKVEPRVAMLSYSNFGASNDEEPAKVRKAVAKIHALKPDFVVDGEIQFEMAFNQEVLKDNYPFSEFVNGAPNVFIFPNLTAATTAQMILQVISGEDAIGPILMGMRKPVHILNVGSSIRNIVNVIAIAVNDAQRREYKEKQLAF